VHGVGEGVPFVPIGDSPFARRPSSLGVFGEGSVFVIMFVFRVEGKGLLLALGKGALLGVGRLDLSDNGLVVFAKRETEDAVFACVRDLNALRHEQGLRCPRQGRKTTNYGG